MSSIKNIVDLILQEIETNTKKNIVIREDRIIDKLLSVEVSQKTLWKHLGQILLLVFECLLIIYLFVSLVSFFLFDVILFEPKVYTTSKGATVITQPCGIEQAFFIHNSASVWTDSGIDIVKGDEIEVSYAGSFYTSLRNQAKASLNNVPLKYPWFSFQRINVKSSNTTIKFCMYDSIEDDAAIGDFLCKIGPQKGAEYIYQIKPKKNHFIAKHSGTLHVSINDIYIPDTRTVKNVLVAPDIIFDNDQKEELIKRLEFDREHLNNKDSLLKQIELIQQIEKITQLSHFEQCEQCKQLYQTKRALSCDIDTSLVNGAIWEAESIWYDDNCGELFVNVKITRNSAHYFNPINKLFAILYRKIDALLSKN